VGRVREGLPVGGEQMLEELEFLLEALDLLPQGSLASSHEASLSFTPEEVSTVCQADRHRSTLAPSKEADRDARPR
jgi:hypothetical protein